MDMCEWCGHDHPAADLCTKRPAWGRRGFLALLGAAAVGLAVKDLPSPTPPSWTEWIKVEFSGDRGTQLYVMRLDIPSIAKDVVARWKEVRDPGEPLQSFVARMTHQLHGKAVFPAAALFGREAADNG